MHLKPVNVKKNLTMRGRKGNGRDPESGKKNRVEG